MGWQIGKNYAEELTNLKEKQLLFGYANDRQPPDRRNPCPRF
jgi:hypothetical protein